MYRRWAVSSQLILSLLLLPSCRSTPLPPPLLTALLLLHLQLTPLPRPLPLPPPMAHPRLLPPLPLPLPMALLLPLPHRIAVPLPPPLWVNTLRLRDRHRTALLPLLPMVRLFPPRPPPMAHRLPPLPPPMAHPLLRPPLPTVVRPHLPPAPPTGRPLPLPPPRLPPRTAVLHPQLFRTALRLLPVLRVSTAPQLRLPAHLLLPTAERPLRRPSTASPATAPLSRSTRFPRRPRPTHSPSSLRADTAQRRAATVLPPPICRLPRHPATRLRAPSRLQAAILTASRLPPRQPGHTPSSRQDSTRPRMLRAAIRSCDECSG